MKKQIGIVLVVIFIMPLLVMSACNNKKDIDTISIETQEFNQNDNNETIHKICVYIVGEVYNPGVYYVNVNSRVTDVVEAAGGFTECAATEHINLASKVTDGEKIIIYSLSQIENNEIINENQSTLININTADVDKLMTLPGIGESKAKDIVRYREKNGRFESKEEIMQVSGIKEAAFEKIEEYITVD